MTSTIGIPIKLLNESTGHIVTVEISSGQIYRGKLIEAEDNMNCQLRDITVTARDGRVSHLDQVYIRGSHVRYFIVPDMLRNAPMFRTRGVKGRGVGLARGRATVSRARGQQRGDLTGSAPVENTDGSLAGTTHEWSLETNYYRTNLPIWLDEISDIDAWTSDFQKPEAREVVQAIGGWIYCVDKSVLLQATSDSSASDRFDKIIKSIEDVISKACGYSWEGVKLAVATSSSKTKTTDSKTFSADEWDDRCMEYGFEFIDAEAHGKNQFSESTGIERLREALEANDWAQTADDDATVEAFGDFEEEEHEMNAELWGLKASLMGADDEEEEHEDGGEGLQVDNLEHLMSQALVIKENGADLPLEERRKYAARAVNSLTNDL
ncbi:hypothetical protein MBLNU457_3907t1 [Dothideomycetes sp. NU457]